MPCLTESAGTCSPRWRATTNPPSAAVARFMDQEFKIRKAISILFSINTMPGSNDGHFKKGNFIFNSPITHCPVATG
jgi:hypothetical protein